jgi:hypothetical protein
MSNDFSWSKNDAVLENSSCKKLRFVIKIRNRAALGIPPCPSDGLDLSRIFFSDKWIAGSNLFSCSAEGASDLGLWSPMCQRLKCRPAVANSSGRMNLKDNRFLCPSSFRLHPSVLDANNVHQDDAGELFP